MKLSDVLVIAVRHGETQLNAKHAFRGKINVSLDAKGEEQAKAVAKKLMGIRFAQVIVSDRKRTIETAEIITEALDLNYDVTANLRAWDIGFLSGKPKNEDNKEILEYYIKHPNIPVPDGESLNAFKARVRPQVMEAIQTAQATGLPVLLIVHSSIIHEIGDMFHNDHEAVLVEPGGIAVIFMDKNKLSAKPVYKTRAKATSHADTIS